MKKILKLIIILLLMLVPILFSFFIYKNTRLKLEPSYNLSESTRNFEQRENLFFNYEITRYPSRINITNINQSSEKVRVGISADITNFNFGYVPQTSSAKKTLNLTNNKDTPFNVKFYVFGNISELIDLEESVTVEPGKSVQVPVRAKSDMETEPGVYMGEVDIVVIVPKKLSEII